MKQLLFASIAPIMWAVAGLALGKSKGNASYPIGIGIGAVILIITITAINKKVVAPVTDYKWLLLIGVSYAIGGYVFNQLVSGKSDGNYWVAITAAMLPVLSLIAAQIAGEKIISSQWVGLSICIIGILLMGKVIRF
jgi:drug/metabolite transporter (DMT)-like permease